MEEESCFTLNFDSGDNVQLKKSFLMKHSQYFEVMFSGKFMETRSDDQITLKEVDYKGFMAVIECLKKKIVEYVNIDELLCILETSLILQFTEISEASMELIKGNVLFSINALSIFFVTSKLGLEKLCKKARAYILYNFKTFVVRYRNIFLHKVKEEDLKLLLSDNELNVEHETDVFDLIIEWCYKTNNCDIECEIAVDCVHFNSMDKNQLKSCLSKTDDLNLQNVIKQYINNLNDLSNQSIELLIKPKRNVPNVLCAMKNDNQHAFIYTWDKDSLQFIRYLQVNPLPRNVTGYHMVSRGMDIFAIGGEINYGKGMWNEQIWKYNILSKEWKQLDNISPTKRRHGIVHIGDKKLYLLGGVRQHRLSNTLLEIFVFDEDNNLNRDKCISCDNFAKKIDRLMYICLEYGGNLVLITRHNPMWYEIFPNYNWESHHMDIKGTIICAINYNNLVYMLVYDDKYNISLYRYYVQNHSHQKIRCFETVYVHDYTMCAFNINEAMVFSKTILESYNIDDKQYKKCSINQNSFHSNYFFTIPLYFRD